MVALTHQSGKWGTRLSRHLQSKFTKWLRGLTSIGIVLALLAIGCLIAVRSAFYNLDFAGWFISPGILSRLLRHSYEQVFISANALPLLAPVVPVLSLYYGYIFTGAQRAEPPTIGRWASVLGLACLLAVDFLIDTHATGPWLFAAALAGLVWQRVKRFRVIFAVLAGFAFAFADASAFISVVFLLSVFRLREVWRRSSLLDSAAMALGLCTILAHLPSVFMLTLRDPEGTKNAITLACVVPCLYLIARRTKASANTFMLLASMLLFRYGIPQEVTTERSGEGAYGYFSDPTNGEILELLSKCTFWSEECAEGAIRYRDGLSGNILRVDHPFDIDFRARLEQIVRFQDTWLIGVGAFETPSYKQLVAMLYSDTTDKRPYPLVGQAVNRAVVSENQRSLILGGSQVLRYQGYDLPITNPELILSKGGGAVYLLHPSGYDKTRNIVYAADFLTSDRLYVIPLSGPVDRVDWIHSGVETPVAVGIDTRNDRLWVSGLLGVAVLQPDGTVLARHRTGVASRIPLVVEELNRVFVPDTVSGNLYEFNMETMELEARHFVGFGVRQMETQPQIPYLITGSSAGTFLFPKTMWEKNFQ